MIDSSAIFFNYYLTFFRRFTFRFFFHLHVLDMVMEGIAAVLQRTMVQR